MSNRLLQALPPADADRLAGQLTQVELEKGRLLYDPGDIKSQQKVRRQFHTGVFWTRRAVRPEDYSQIIERMPFVQRASSTTRWTGSWSCSG